MKQITVTKYVADDGTEFDTEAMCQRHEYVTDLCNEVEEYYGGVARMQMLSTDEVVEYIVDNFALSRVTLEGLSNIGC